MPDEAQACCLMHRYELHKTLTESGELGHVPERKETGGRGRHVSGKGEESECRFFCGRPRKNFGLETIENT